MRLSNLVFLSLAFVAACDDYTPLPEDDGPANAAFAYECTSLADATCGGAPSVAVPPAIAAGSQFSLSFVSAPGVDASSVWTLATSTNDIVERDDSGNFFAVRSGDADVLAETADGSIAGYASVTVHDVASLAVLGVAKGASLQVGATQIVSARPLDDQAMPLAGTLVYDYVALDPNVITVTRTSDDELRGTATITATAPGVTSLYVNAGTTLAIVTLTVKGGAS